MALSEKEILKVCRGIGATWIEAPPEVIALWEAGWLRRDSELPHTYTTVDGAVEKESNEDE